MALVNTGQSAATIYQLTFVDDTEKSHSLLDTYTLGDRTLEAIELANYRQLAPEQIQARADFVKEWCMGRYPGLDSVQPTGELIKEDLENCPIEAESDIVYQNLTEKYTDNGQGFFFYGSLPSMMEAGKSYYFTGELLSKDTNKGNEKPAGAMLAFLFTTPDGVWDFPSQPEVDGGYEWNVGEVTSTSWFEVGFSFTLTAPGSPSLSRLDLVLAHLGNVIGLRNVVIREVKDISIVYQNPPEKSATYILNYECLNSLLVEDKSYLFSAEVLPDEEEGTACGLFPFLFFVKPDASWEEGEPAEKDESGGWESTLENAIHITEPGWQSINFSFTITPPLKPAIFSKLDLVLYLYAPLGYRIRMRNVVIREVNS